MTVPFAGLAARQSVERAYERAPVPPATAGNGAFTRALLDLLASGPERTYRELVAEAGRSTRHQQPRVYWYDDAGLAAASAFV